MIRLLKNELFKIFHKKGVYIIFVITIALTGLIVMLNNIDLVSKMDDASVQYARQSVEEYEAGGVEFDDFYVEQKTQLLTYDLKKEVPAANSYESPEYYYLTSVVGGLSRSYYNYKYVAKDETTAATVKVELDKSIETFKNFDWKKVIQDDIDEIYKQEKECKEYKGTNCLSDYDKERIKVLNYRLDNNVPYSFNYASEELNDYLTYFNDYQDQEKDESKITKHDELYDKKDTEGKLYKLQYKIDNKLIRNNDNMLSAQEVFFDAMGNISIFIIIAIVLVSSAVVADEFNKGTIKQLLVRPYSRTKILFSKLIAVCITVMLFVVLVAIGQTVLSGIINGTFNTLLDPYVMYNYNAHEVLALNNIVAGLLHYACVIPEILILILITFFVSVLLTNNGISTACGIVTYASAGIFELYLTAKKFISYIPLVNWDFTQYLFGGISECKYLYLTKSLVISLVTIFVLTVLTLVIFKRKDIKNQ